ncbi:MAG: ribonuclease III domain-containing protein [Syntrophomonas sp.]
MLKHEIVDEKSLAEYSPLVLAYIGDAVFELMVRTRAVLTGKRKIRDIHRETVSVVRAENQAKLIRALFDDLTEEEQGIVKWGRNAKSTPPKNVEIGDYRMSTGFEALLGFLYLKGDEERLLYLVSRVLEIG